MRFWPISASVDSKRVRGLTRLRGVRLSSLREAEVSDPVKRILGCKKKTAADEAAAVRTDHNLT
jgi:hypothetical protein